MTWEDKFKQNLLEILYRPDQPRDEKGRWTSGGSGAAGDEVALMPAPNIGSFVKEGGVVELSLGHLSLSARTSEFTPEQQASIGRAFADTLGGVQLDGVRLEESIDGSGYMGRYYLQENIIAFDVKQDYSSEGLEKLSTQNEYQLGLRKADALRIIENHDAFRDACDDFYNKRSEGYPDFVDPNTGEVLFEKPRTGPLGGARHRKAEADFIQGGMQEALERYQHAAWAVEPLVGTPRTYTYADWEVKDRLYAIAKHEAYHAVYYNPNLSTAWDSAVRQYGVTHSDICKVSEYARTNRAEFFAETGTAIDLGLSVPDNVRQAFEHTMRLAEGVRK